MHTAKLLILLATLLEPYDLPMPEVSWEKNLGFQRERSWIPATLGLTSCTGYKGVDSYSRCWIVLNECLKGSARLLERTVKHEMAHYITSMTTHTMDHGKEWRRIAKEIGLDSPNRAKLKHEVRRRCPR
jgi:hypothetical protein